MDTEGKVRDSTVSLGALRCHYRDWGNPAAPPLVLLHGFTGNARQWDTVARIMADGYRVLALDQRGHGETDWAPDQDYTAARVHEDFAAFVAALGLDRIALVGFSFGGEVAYGYAALHPDRVARLVLVEPGDPPDTPAVRSAAAAFRALPMAFRSPEAAMASFARAGLAPFAPAEELRHWVRAGLTQTPDGRWTWRVDPVLLHPDPQGRERLTHGRETMWRLLPQVACPTLLVRGAASAQTPGADLTRMAAVMPNAQIASIPRAGHWTPLDNPTGFVRRVRDFLAAG
jgi:pimeloyl-ACP methyl ester carboxylesterase